MTDGIRFIRRGFGVIAVFAGGNIRTMKIFSPILLALCFISTTYSLATEPLPPTGGALGVRSGVYQGEGKLISDSPWVPNVRFESNRQITDGSIVASTRAYFLGIEVAAAQARLKVSDKADGKFSLLDLNAGEAVCGSGQCDASGCTFTATVMDGELTLTETWVADEAGFSVLKGSQVFKGKSATYEARFAPMNY